MPSQVISLPTLFMTSSAVDTSTQAIPAVDISDAIAISGFINAATTVPGFVLQVAYTSGTDATFVNLTQIYPLSTAAGNALGGSTGLIGIYVTSQSFTVPDICAKQARYASSNVTSTSSSIVWAKRVEV